MMRLALLLVVLAGSCALAEEPDDLPPATAKEDPAVNLASFRALTGMREMIDARTPEGNWHIRTGAFIQGGTEAIGTEGDIRTRTRDRYELVPYIGASFLGHLEVGFRWPFPQFENTRDRVHDATAPTTDPWPSLRHTDTYAGGGNFGFAAKAGWTLGPVSLAAYGLGQTNTGSRLMTHKEDSFGEVGGAGTVSIAGRFGIHLNLAGRCLETRELGWEFLYRTGFSFTLVTSETAVVRTFIYGEGCEHEGSRGTDYRVGAGVQLQLAERAQLELTGEGRLLAQSLPRPLIDQGTYSVAFGAGFTY